MSRSSTGDGDLVECLPFALSLAEFSRGTQLAAAAPARKSVAVQRFRLALGFLEKPSPFARSTFLEEPLKKLSTLSWESRGHLLPPLACGPVVLVGFEWTGDTVLLVHVLGSFSSFLLAVMAVGVAFLPLT